jgi:transcriptional regulator with XRE-family HTH domain
MATAESTHDRGSRQGRRALHRLAEELRGQRLSLGLSQATVAHAARMSRSRYTRVEAGRIEKLSLMEACRLTSALGLQLAVRAYPGGDGLRDTAQARRIDALAGHVRAPLVMQSEIPLPERADRPEPRAWDAQIVGLGRRTAVEVEMRLTDAQATERRIALKRRDDPPSGFLLIVADTVHNRRVLAEHPGLFPDLPRLRPSRVFRFLEAGQHPPSGLVLF